MKDVFLCHASENKVEIIEPLTLSFDQHRISYWLDSQEIGWGDSLTSHVNVGINESKFAIVVLSLEFLKKNWPQRELNALLNLEASNGEVKVLPPLVGDEEAIRKIIGTYPLLNDKKYLVWTGDSNIVVDALHQKLKKLSMSGNEASSSSFDKPLPKIKKNFTDHEKHRFSVEAFTKIKNYFKEGVTQIQKQTDRIEVEFLEINNLKFSALIFLDGELLNQCLIWWASHSSSYQINYYEGRNINPHSDSAMNDWLSIQTKGDKIFLESSGMDFTQSRREMNATEGAEYFWRRFTDRLIQT